MEKQLEFLLKNFSFFYQIGTCSIGYSSPNADISIVQSVSPSFWKERKDIDTQHIVWKKWKDVEIPFLFSTDSSQEIISYVDGKATINYDIVASTFYFLSGWNELVNPQKDSFGRVKYADSMIKKLNISHIPVVNYYFEILREAIETLTKKEIKIHRWGEHSFAVSLTHDIDTCLSGWLEGSFSELKKKRFLSIPKLVFKRFFQQDDWFNFQTIVDVEAQFGASSSFYFLPQKGKEGQWKNADYNINSKPIQNVIASLKNTPNEIGVHGSFGTHVNTDKFKTDIANIQHQPIVGNRFHFLMFEPEKTVSVLEAADIKYDTSLGFAEQIGFRRGTCYPFYLYNFETERISPVIEIPLIAMDTTLASTKYMGISQAESLPQLFQLVDEVKKFGGIFTLLWHNTYFSDYKYTGWKDVYVKTLRYCKENNGLLSNGKFMYEKLK